jgi:hypothetical protein
VSDDIQGIAKGEPHPEQEQTEPHDVVIVLASTSTDSSADEEFGKYVEDIKALHTFKDNVRGYLLVDQAAKNVLAKVEKPAEGVSGRAVMVISFDQPEDTDEAVAKLAKTADTVRDLFKDEHDVRVDVAIREVADEVLGAFPSRGGE